MCGIFQQLRESCHFPDFVFVQMIKFLWLGVKKLKNFLFFSCISEKYFYNIIKEMK